MSAEISIATETATANWRKSWPLMPGMNATGTNTESSTSVMAMIGPGDLRHRLLASLRHGEFGLLLEHALDVLDDHDGVVDHDADGEDERQQRDRVGRIADRQQHREGPDDRHGHGNEGDERRPELAEEQEDHKWHENDRHRQRANDFLDRRGDEHRGVVEHVIGEIVGKPRRQRVHGLADAARHVDRVGPGRLVDADGGRRRAVEAAVAVLRSCDRAHLDAGDVLDPNDGAVGIGAQDDVGELLRARQPTLGLDGELKLLVLSTGAAPTRPSAAWMFWPCTAAMTSFGVRLNCGQAVGIEPDAYASSRAVRRE